MKRSTLIFIVCALFSCKSANTDQISDTHQSASFRIFLKKFKPVELPFVFKYGNFEDSLNFDAMPSVDQHSDDTLYVKEDDLSEIKCYGMLKDTSRFFSLIYFYPADSYYPMLITYDYKGNIIDKTSLIVHGCSGDCGLEYCSVTGMIHEDLSIVCADTIIWKFSCDSLGEPIPNSDSVWVNSKSGKIADNGKMIMQKEQQQKYRDSH